MTLYVTSRRQMRVHELLLSEQYNTRRRYALLFPFQSMTMYWVSTKTCHAINSLAWLAERH